LEGGKTLRAGAQRYEARRRRGAVRRRRLAALPAEDPARRPERIGHRTTARERRKPNLSGAPENAPYYPPSHKRKKKTRIFIFF